MSADSNITRFASVRNLFDAVSAILRFDFDAIL